jgi:ribosomal protein L16/L10AE
MGKGKGTFEFWATRLDLVIPLPFDSVIDGRDSVPTGRVIFEIGGSPIREELARDGKW